MPVSSTHDRLPPPLGRYHFLARLGSGSMGEVFLAVAASALGFRKLHVIKQIRRGLAEEPEFLEMFLDEAGLATRLNHPNVVQTLEADCIDGRYFMAMEFLDGQPLHHVLHRSRDEGLPISHVLAIVSSALSGLQHAHELADFDGTPLGVVHRDVSPGNIFVTYSGQVKLVDFGVAKATTRVSQTRVGTIKGKAGYMAPEQMIGGEVDLRADIFGIGVVLWEAVANRRLWGSATDVEMVRAADRGVPALRDARADAPVELEAICERALARDPGDRYASAAEMRADLETFAARLGAPPPSRLLGDLVAAYFVEERSRLRQTVQKRIEQFESQSDLPFDSEDEGTRTMMSPTAQIPRLIPPSIPPEPTSISLLPPRPAEARRSFRFAALAAAAALLGGGFALLMRAPPARTSPSPDALAAGASPVAAPTSEADAALIELSVSVTPPGATVWLDGAELPNPFVGKFRRGGEYRKLEARAPGHLPVSRMLALESSTSIEITLEPRLGDAPGDPPPAGPLEKPSRGVPEAPAASSADPVKPPGLRRAIDTDDPWR